MYSNGIETVTGVRNGHLWPTNSVTVALDIPLRVVFQVPDCCLNGSDALWDIAMPSGDVLPTNGNTWSVGARHDNDKHLVERENHQETDNRLLPSLSDDVDIEHHLKSVASRFTSRPNASGFDRTTCNECAGNSVLDEIDKMTVTSHEFDNDSEDCCNDQWDVDCRDVVPDDCDKAGDSRADEMECDCGRDGRKSHNNYSNDVYAMSSSDELLTESQQNACSANCLSGQLSDVDSAIYRSPCSNFWQTAYIDLTSNDADCVDDGVDMAMSSSCDEVFDFEDCDNDSCCLEPPEGGSAMDSVRALAVRLGLQVMTSPNHVTLDGNGRRDGEGVVEEGIESTADGATKGKQSATVEKLVKIVDDLHQLRAMDETLASSLLAVCARLQQCKLQRQCMRHRDDLCDVIDTHNARCRLATHLIPYVDLTPAEVPCGLPLHHYGLTRADLNEVGERRFSVL